MSKPSGSSIERGVQCPASFALGQANSTSPGSIKGTENHDGIEGELVAGTESKHRVVREALEGSTDVRVELAYALDVEAETVRYLGSRLARNYGVLGPTEIALTVDAVIEKIDGVNVWVELWDWKSRKRVTRAKKNWQLKAGAVCVMKHLGLSKLLVGIGYLDNDESDKATVDAFDIPVFFADMRAMFARISDARELVSLGKSPTVHEGAWCDYCPAMSFCPAKTAIAKAMLPELGDIEQSVAFMTAEQVGLAWVKLKKVQTLAEKVEASLKLRAKQELIPLPSGKRLALVECKRSAFDKKKAVAWIEKQGGDLKQFDGVTHYEQVKEINMPATGTDE